jgi:hypothetical protein
MWPLGPLSYFPTATRKFGQSNRILSGSRLYTRRWSNLGVCIQDALSPVTASLAVKMAEFSVSTSAREWSH